MSETSITMDDLIVLTTWMAEHNYTAGEVAYAVEKPWKFLDVLAIAKGDNE